MLLLRSNLGWLRTNSANQSHPSFPKLEMLSQERGVYWLYPNWGYFFLWLFRMCFRLSVFEMLKIRHDFYNSNVKENFHHTPCDIRIKTRLSLSPYSLTKWELLIILSIGWKSLLHFKGISQCRMLNCMRTVANVFLWLFEMLSYTDFFPFWFFSYCPFTDINRAQA